MTPGAVASASIRAISSALDFAAWLETEALRAWVGRVGWYVGDALREVEGLETRELRFVVGFSSMVDIAGWDCEMVLQYGTAI